jgi:chromosome segregation ATPase
MSNARIEELRVEIERVVARIAHLDSEARATEAGTVEWKEKLDADKTTLLGYERTLKVSPSSAVAYWKEVRETEKRLDDLRADLRRLTDGSPMLVEVRVTFDGPQE